MITLRAIEIAHNLWFCFVLFYISVSLLYFSLLFAFLCCAFSVICLAVFNQGVNYMSNYYYYYYYYYYPCYHLYAGYLQLYTSNKPCFRVHNVAAALYLQFALHVMLFRPRNMFCTFTLALIVVCVQCPIRLFFSFISCFPGMLFRYCLGDPEIVPVAPIIAGITFAFKFHMR